MRVRMSRITSKIESAYVMLVLRSIKEESRGMIGFTSCRVTYFNGVIPLEVVFTQYFCVDLDISGTCSGDEKF